MTIDPPGDVGGTRPEIYFWRTLWGRRVRVEEHAHPTVLRDLASPTDMRVRRTGRYFEVGVFTWLWILLLRRILHARRERLCAWAARRWQLVRVRYHDPSHRPPDFRAPLLLGRFGPDLRYRIPATTIPPASAPTDAATSSAIAPEDRERERERDRERDRGRDDRESN